MNGAAEQRAADATRKARGETDGNNEHNNQPVRPRNNTLIRAEGVRGVAGGSRRGMNGGEDGAEERSAVRIFISFSSADETNDPWPLISL